MFKNIISSLSLRTILKIFYRDYSKNSLFDKTFIALTYVTYTATPGIFIAPMHKQELWVMVL